MQAVPHAQMDVPSNISATVVQAAAGIVGANSTGHNQTLPGPAGKRHVVMHHEHGVHHLPHKQARTHHIFDPEATGPTRDSLHLSVSSFSSYPLLSVVATCMHPWQLQTGLDIRMNMHLTLPICPMLSDV